MRSFFITYLRGNLNFNSWHFGKRLIIKKTWASMIHAVLQYSALLELYCERVMGYSYRYTYIFPNLSGSKELAILLCECYEVVML